MVESSDKLAVITTLELFQSSLKIELLFFDKIVLSSIKPLNLGQFSGFDREQKAMIYANVEYLKENEVLLDSGALLEPEEHNKLEELSAHRENVLIQAMTHFESMGEGIKPAAELQKTFMAHDRHEMVWSLIAKGFNAVPTFASNSQFETEHPKGNQDCLKVIFEAMPLPDESVPLEAILDFRKDSNNIQMRLAFDKWINKIAVQSMNPVEIKEELNYLLNEYTRAYERFKMRTTLNSICSVLGSAALVANLDSSGLVQLIELGAAVGLGLKVVKDATSFTYDISQLPGREVAFIHHAQRMIGTKDT